MKKLDNIFLTIVYLGIWIISPIWITMIIMNLSGCIYQYDYSMDEGTAGIIGSMLLVLWIFLALIPGVYFLKYLRKKFVRILLLGILVLGCLPLYYPYSSYVSNFFGASNLVINSLETIFIKVYWGINAVMSIVLLIPHENINED